MTKRRLQALDFIIAFTDRNRYAPSYQEIADGMGLRSLASVHKMISTLDGIHLDRDPKLARSLKVRPQFVAEYRIRKGGGACPTCGSMFPIKATA